MQLLRNVNTLEWIVTTVVVLLSIPVISLVGWITDYYSLGFVIYIAIFVWLMRYVGRFAMYPGSTAYITGELQTKLSNELMANCQHINYHFNNVINIVTNKSIPRTNHYFGFFILRHFQSMHALFDTLQGQKLTIRKKNIKQKYQQLVNEMEMQQMSSELFSQQLEQFQIFNTLMHQSKYLTLANILNSPEFIERLNETQFAFIIERCVQCGKLIEQIRNIFKSFKIPAGGAYSPKIIKFYLFDEKLYDLQFGFKSWQATYRFQRNIIKINGYQLETAIIYQDKTARNSERPRQQTILFCNPNGVFIQFFGLDNAYIRFYLRMGYQIVLWNYRGYGASTGIPTISNCQKDAKIVYDYYANRGFKIPMVHGYSIGGCAAIGLASKQPQIKILIADRTFSRISKMVQQLGSIVKIGAKVLFYFDDIALQQQFKACQTKKKLIISDSRDQVIVQIANLKNSILESFIQNKEKKLKLKQNSLNQENQLNEPSEVIHYTSSQIALKVDGIKLNRILIKKFTKAIRDIFDSILGNETQRGVYENQINSIISNGKNFRQNQKIAEDIISILGELDGAGVMLFNKNNLQHFLGHCSIKQFEREWLIFYGSYANLPTHQYRKLSQIKQKTIVKIEIALERLNQIRKQQMSQTQQQGDSIQNIQTNSLYKNLKIIESILSQANRHLKQNLQNKKLERQLGSVILTNNGHNCQLTKQQFQCLRSFILHEEIQ